ncbi:MAG: C4-dicarboxylate ABC transporter permease [Betaproteobacteria bacterium RIFCSPLOWO2_12_FULL_65_14]|nr:MAG: C4-dicarboxylate ABC transporter permease [Betaproteobacteria bacterium RIFCSPLOWO2_12_FULL_65_14]
MRWVVGTIAIAMSLYHMYVAAFGPPEALIFRGTHLMFATTLVFLLYPFRAEAGWSWRALDVLFLVAGLGIVLHIFFNYQYYTNRIIYIDELTLADKLWAVTAIVVVLEGTRRVIGWALPLTALVFLAYALSTKVTLPVLLEQVYLSTEGIFGSTLGVSASYVMLFVLFGAFMERSGTGQLFMDFAMSITGHTAGGPGKVAVVSSSLFGTVSGSAVANVMVDGPITIPLMKRTGFRPPFAAAVEAVASTGGQLMPPIMGAAAFVMAEFLAVPYAQVAVWAIIPALLYYLAVFSAVHFEAKRYKLAGVPKSQLPRFGGVMLERGHLFVPILIVLFGLLLGYSAPLCALAGALSCLPLALLRASTRAGITWRTVLEALQDGARNTLAVAMACACAGIVIACVTITGLGIVFTQLVVALAQDTLILALVLTALAGIVLGMGMPTTPAYIMMVALLVPAVIKLGITGCPEPVTAECKNAVTPAAHMFAFYFAILSAITPPVALAVYAAAGLAKANMWQTGFAAMRAAAPAYIVPFMFVYEPMLLLVVQDWSAEWPFVAWSVLTASLGVVCLAASLFGWLLGFALVWQRVLLFIAALALIKPGLVTDTVGLALLAVVGAAQLAARRRSAATSEGDVAKAPIRNS